MAQNVYVTSPTEEWEGLVAWDGELFDPMFHSDTNFTGQGSSFASNYHVAESVNSEQPYLVSAPPSVVDGPPSLEYTFSAPPSMVGDSSSYGQAYCTSPSFDTNATSPLLSQGTGHYFGSFDACDRTLSPLVPTQESPILDTRWDRIEDSLPSTGSFEATTETVFNPHIAGSAHSFSGRDVRASQVFANVGTWTDHPQINIEPIVEADEYSPEAAPISIPYPHSQSLNTFPSWPRSEEAPLHIRSRAVTIPQAKRRPASFNSAISQSQWSQRVPPMLSVSPGTSRRQRSVALSRSNSRNGSRRGMATPSPTESFGWVSYHINSQTNRLAPTSTEGMQGRTPRGRKKGLTAEQRTHAALMRVVGACANCQRRKEKCDPGTPCKSCLDHYKGDLVNHPCRDRVLSDQSSAFLSDRLGWHPTARPLESFLAPNDFAIHSGFTYNIPLYFGFGPPLSMSVHALEIENMQTQIHKHVVYSWPPESGTGDMCNHAVLPAVLTTLAMSNLMQTLDRHLALLVTNHFRHFPLYTSPLRILRDVYVYFRSLSSTPQSRTLHQALKLLVLVHIGGDITLPPPSDNLVLSQLVQDTMGTSSNLTPTPCFIRSQFGKVMPGLALSLMKDVLSSLEQLLLNRECEDWPITLAILITVLMTIESIQYHAAKAPYHSSYDAPRSSNTDDNHHLDEEGVKTLLAFYSACFSGCHARLRPDWEGEATPSQCASSPDDVFVENVREAIRKATSVGYLSRKVTEKRDGDDMGHFFDRLVARLLLLKL
ncbi:hypothetical protein FB567DRAFT_596460 [Paraphoma chrysanthemicola]|uniref:Zn(2)-C6 fungal-type domain-containing protein n=1 Tax=Paraphoma chrysanthemicola TaxID=798071 RepID=A0A8K0QZT0_9PLEO|nr:hypothetical protein FB567DRAFT_596460 [Paraphoma chrysanthemicola]